MRLTKLALGMLAIGVWVGPNNLYAQRQAIDVNRSSLTIRVFKSGVFSGFAHDHEIQARVAEGGIDSSANPGVQLRLDSRKMHVMDPDIDVYKRQVLVFVDLFLVNAYRRRKLEGARVVVSHRVAANGVAVRCGRAIASVSIA